jgi:hypothetical protein
MNYYILYLLFLPLGAIDQWKFLVVQYPHRDMVFAFLKDIEALWEFSFRGDIHHLACGNVWEIVIASE